MTTAISIISYAMFGGLIFGIATGFEGLWAHSQNRTARTAWFVFSKNA